MDKKFLEDVINGLTASPKFLSSKYFYDNAGHELFQKIMALDEYYLTDCEYEIFTRYKATFLDHFVSNCDLFHLVELGAGDAFKTKILLTYFLDQKVSFEYDPIDISASVLDMLLKDLNHLFPQLSVHPLNKEYFKALEEMSQKNTFKKVILFLGSNIGNFSETETHEFFGHMADVLQPGDHLLTGFDLKKDPHLILAAYNDSQGVTREFNLNLLRRINRELHADFEVGQFYHYPLYDPADGAARSYLMSRKKQEVSIGINPTIIKFEKDEPIFMEISQKYTLEDIEDYAVCAGFRIKGNYFDHKKYFINSLWEL